MGLKVVQHLINNLKQNKNEPKQKFKNILDKNSQHDVFDPCDSYSNNHRM